MTTPKKLPWQFRFIAQPVFILLFAWAIWWFCGITHTHRWMKLSLVGLYLLDAFTTLVIWPKLGHKSLRDDSSPSRSE